MDKQIDEIIRIGETMNLKFNEPSEAVSAALDTFERIVKQNHRISEEQEEWIHQTIYESKIIEKLNDLEDEIVNNVMRKYGRSKRKI